MMLVFFLPQIFAALFKVGQAQRLAFIETGNSALD